MPDLTLAQARQIADGVLQAARDAGFKPMVVAVLDARGQYKALLAEDGTSLHRAEIAHGKAYGALSLGMGSRAIFKRAGEQPFFVDAVAGVSRGALIPVPGGVLVRDSAGTLLGAVGVSGDVSDNDETCAVKAVEAAGLKADPG